MYSTIIIFGISVIIMIWNLSKYHDGLSDILMRIVLVLTITFTLSLFVNLIAPLFIPKGTKTVTTKIASLNDNIIQEGEYFLGTGETKGTMYFYYYIEKDGIYELDRVPTNTSKIIYDDNPRIEYEKKYLKSPYDDWFFNHSCNNRITYRIYVPEGSINTRFKLDGE